MKMTKNLILFIPVLIWLAGCGKKELFKASQMEEIRIEQNIPAQTSNAKIVSDREVVKQFIEAINGSQQDSIKFTPTWRILITDNKGNIHLVFCTKREFRYKGQTYKSKDDLEQILMPK